MKDIDPLHDIMFRYLFLEDRPKNLLLLLNGLLECKGGERLTEILSAYRRREYLNNRHYCEMVTILATDKENRTSLILIALDPHPESEDYVLPLMLAETEKVGREHSRISAAGRGIILSSSAYNHYRTSKDRKKPLFHNRQIEGGHFHLTVINLFRLTSPFPRRPITPREEWMHFLNYADIYLLAEPTYSLPSFLAGSIAPVWRAYRQGCKKEQLYWRIEEYTKACLDENSRLDDAIKRARKAGKKEAGKFLRAELGALGLDKSALDTLIYPFITQKDS